MWVEIALVAVLILINAALSGSEMALVSLRESQINRLAADSEKGRRLARLTSDPNQFLSTIQIGITLAGALASATAAVSLAQPLIEPLGFLGSAADPVAVFIVTVVLTYFTLVVGELAPKRIAMQTAQGWAMRAAGPINLIATLARPLVWVLARSTELVVRMVGLDPKAVREEVSEEEIKDMIASQESIPEQQRSIIEGALELDERKLYQVLVPRTDVVFVTAAQDASTARDLLIEAGLSRAPVIGETEDDVIGFVHLRQLVAGVGSVSDYVRPALVLPDSAGVLQALGRMQQQRGQLALVMDEFGAVAGIVTLEDLLEEIVGEIYDEFDLDTAQVVHRPDGDIELNGSFPAHDLPDLGIDLDAGRSATIAGIMLEALGEFPAAGTETVVGHWRLTAIEVTPRAILRVQVHPLDEQELNQIEEAKVAARQARENRDLPPAPEIPREGDARPAAPRPTAEELAGLDLTPSDPPARTDQS
ncbi:HlyC/CorC family transporter [Kineosporia sp. J2-2]|uniref:HlyC/CorC family transporter n=1 Tax=Kineosporia corallincola TaxID=2835133 RepID=A0ABS5TAQ3_9ACTN|nr:hemolysin family protein [Kineosporia corallincola]MBT0767291.1 HlyC/CorC family transporter [Kineosporia corallincola]